MGKLSRAQIVPTVNAYHIMSFVAWQVCFSVSMGSNFFRVHSNIVSTCAENVACFMCDADHDPVVMMASYVLFVGVFVTYRAKFKILSRETAAKRHFGNGFHS